jgi:pilus assembly protein TadC
LRPTWIARDLRVLESAEAVAEAVALTDEVRELWSRIDSGSSIEEALRQIRSSEVLRPQGGDGSVA